MPRRAALDRQSLIALGPERLADLLLELASNDPALKRQLKLSVISSANPADAASLVRERLATVRRSRTFLDWKTIKPLAKELSIQREAITGPIAQADPAQALSLLWDFLTLGESVLGRCDDSNGLMGDVFRDACRHLGPLAQAAHPDPAALAHQAFEAYSNNGYGLYDDLIAILADTLGSAGLAALQALLEQLGREPVGVPPRQWTVKDGLQAVAQARGDVDGYIAQFSERERRMPRIAAGIATKLLKAGRPSDALQALEQGTPQRTGWPVLDWEDARIAVLQALGRLEDAQTARWTCFTQTLQGSYLKDYLQELPDFEDVEAEQRAITLAAATTDAVQGLHFLLTWPTATAEAARLLLERQREFGDDHYDLLSAAAERLSAGHPLAATVALRSMVDFTLSKGRSSRYGDAAEHLHTCQLLSQRISDWGAITPHALYIDAIRSNHARKSSFWGQAKALGLSPEREPNVDAPTAGD